MPLNWFNRVVLPNAGIAEDVNDFAPSRFQTIFGRATKFSWLGPTANERGRGCAFLGRDHAVQLIGRDRFVEVFDRNHDDRTRCDQFARLLVNGFGNLALATVPQPSQNLAPHGIPAPQFKQNFGVVPVLSFSRPLLLRQAS